MNEGKLEMEVVLNATLSGGVAMGCSADISPHPIIPLIVGCITGVISAIGFMKINGTLSSKLNIHDTCGVHYLHGIPGIIGGLVGAFHCANIFSFMGDNNATLFLAGLGGTNRNGSS
jgi:ammonium transporter Rh